MIREIYAHKSKCKLKFNNFLFLLVTFRSPMLCFKACEFNDKLIVLMSRSKVKFCHKNERKYASNATFRGRVENYISLICWFKCLLEYTLEFIGLYGMLLTLCHLQVEATVFFLNEPNKVDRPPHDVNIFNMLISLFYRVLKDFISLIFVWSSGMDFNLESKSL